MTITAAALTDRGQVRAVNQDAVFASTEKIGPLPNLFMVADGMGGHLGGDYCSKNLIGMISADVKAQKSGSETGVILRAIDRANEALFLESGKNPDHAGMGSTLVAGVLSGEQLYVFNIGDSRLYIIGTDGSIRQVTRDHSFVEEMVTAGRMVRGSSDYLLHKNIITRAVAIDERVDADVFEVSFRPGDTMLLCSDGLTNMVEDREIARIVSGSCDLDTAAAALVSEANGNGGRDNISVVLASVSDGEGAA